MTNRRPLGQALTLAALVFIGALTLFPNSQTVAEVAKTSFWCLICGDVGAVDVLLNIALFVPLGIGLGLWGRRFRSAVLIAFCVTVLVESLQATIIVGRDSSISDIITNTAGGALGWLLARLGAALVLPGPRFARRAAVMGALGWLLGYAFSGWGLAVAPPPGIYWGQWTHYFPGGSTYNGKMLDATLGGMAIPDERLDSTARVRDILGSQEFDLVVHATSSEPYELAQVFGIAHQGEGIFLEWRQDGQDYLLRLRSRSANVRLRSTAMRISDVAPWKIGEPITLVLSRHHGVMTATVDAAGRGHRSHTQPLTPSLGWSLLWPFRQGYTWATPWWSALWMLAITLPVAWWTVRARSRTLAALAGGALAGGLVLVPPLFSLPSTPVREWIAVGLAFAAAVLLDRLLASRPPPVVSPGTAASPDPAP